MPGPRRLVEVDLPIGRLGAHGRREKALRHGHISTLHTWWARKPLGVCRAEVLAALWPDPADPACPAAFRAAVAQHLGPLWARWGRPAADLGDPRGLRRALLDFVAEFAAWERSADPEWLGVARALVAAAHEALGGAPGTRPLVVDPFAGGGAIPLEALRVGADALASDLNPVAVLLNEVLLRYVPRYGPELAEAVRREGRWVRERAEAELAGFYPPGPDGTVPLAYVWCRTVRCEGPGCGAEVPLASKLWLARTPGRSVSLELEVDRAAAPGGRVRFRIREGADGAGAVGTVRRGAATCPLCGYTTPVARVREQLRVRRGGASDAQLVAVVGGHPGAVGRSYRVPTEADLAAVRQAEAELARRSGARLNGLPAVPDEPLPPEGTLGFSVQGYGMRTWADLFTPRQLLALTTLAGWVRQAAERVAAERGEAFGRAVGTCLALALDRQADYGSSLCHWVPRGEYVGNTFARQAVAMVWDFVEVNPFAGATGGWDGAVAWVAEVCAAQAEGVPAVGQALMASATDLPLPDAHADLLVTDPPYYDAVPYADLSDFFYVWLRRTVGDLHPRLFAAPRAPRDEECVVNRGAGKDRGHFEATMRRALAACRRVLAEDGVAVFVFAHKSTAGWEAMLRALLEAGWTVTASWPLDTEMGTRLRARHSAVLGSSVHLVCRARRGAEVGDWREVLSELPARVRAWLPRLAREGVVGADAVFACLGPALEVFSRYARVEKASGEPVDLAEYLEEVWAAVAREALRLVFDGADAHGLEPDGRLTAMWLWTLAAGRGGTVADGPEAEEHGAGWPSGREAAFALDFDTARKIAQGLGADLEQLARPGGVVEVCGESARLVRVWERERALLGSRRGPASGPAASAVPLGTGDAWPRGATVLDRLHQAMLLFARGRTEELGRFLVHAGVGRDDRLWRLGQALAALYPVESDERRWVEGVLAERRRLRL